MEIMTSTIHGHVESGCCNSEWNHIHPQPAPLNLSLSAQRSSGKLLAPPPAACVNGWAGVSAGWAVSRVWRHCSRTVWFGLLYY